MYLHKYELSELEKIYKLSPVCSRRERIHPFRKMHACYPKAECMNAFPTNGKPILLRRERIHPFREWKSNERQKNPPLRWSGGQACIWAARLVADFLPALEGSSQLFGDVDLGLLGLQHGRGNIGSHRAVGHQTGGHSLPGGEGAVGCQLSLIHI